METAYSGENAFYIRFSAEQNAFRLVALDGKDYSDCIGKCVMTEGEVKIYGSIPYLEVKNQLAMCQ